MKTGQAVNVSVDGLRCVVVRSDKYDRVIELIQYDDAELDPREMYPAILKLLDEDDENPDQYLEYLDDPPR